MATFVPGRPITTDQPFIDVDPGLSVGAHRFQLVVLDAQGNRSVPDIQTVTVVRLPIGPVGPIGPTGPIDPIPTRPVRSPQGATKPQGQKRPRRGGTQ